MAIMDNDRILRKPSIDRLDRRRLVKSGLGATAGAAATTMTGWRTPLMAQPATPGATPVGGFARVPLWEIAAEQGIVYGTSLATWQAADEEYLPLVDHEAALLFTEDDLLWWRLKPEPGAPLDFTYADQFMAIAQDQNQYEAGDFATPSVRDLLRWRTMPAATTPRLTTSGMSTTKLPDLRTLPALLRLDYQHLMIRN